MSLTSSDSRKFVLNRESTIKSAAIMRTRHTLTSLRQYQNKGCDYQQTPAYRQITQLNMECQDNQKALESSSNLDTSIKVQAVQSSRTVPSFKDLQVKLYTIAKDSKEVEINKVPTNSLGVPIKGLGFSEYSQKVYYALVQKANRIRSQSYYLSQTKRQKRVDSVYFKSTENSQNI